MDGEIAMALSTDTWFIGLVNWTWNGASSGWLSALVALAWGASGANVGGASPATCLAGRPIRRAATSTATAPPTMPAWSVPALGSFRRGDARSIGARLIGADTARGVASGWAMGSERGSTGTIGEANFSGGPTRTAIARGSGCTGSTGAGPRPDVRRRTRELAER